MCDAPSSGKFDLYTKFEEKCNETKTHMQLLRDVYNDAPSSARLQVGVHTTRLGSHTVWIRTADSTGGEFVTLYILRSSSMKKKKKC